MRSNPSPGVKQNDDIQLYSRALRWAWIGVLCVTIACEVMPLAPVAPAVLYSYVGWKLILFVTLGVLTPLTFWRFDSLGFGILMAAATAGMVELLQSLSRGHRSSYLEFGGKLVLIFLGFLAGLNARYDGVIAIGKFRRYLVNTHAPQSTRSI